MLYWTVIDSKVNKNQKHIKMTKKGHKCVECRDRFESLEKLREHEKDCGMMYRCMKCYKWYESKRYLEDHKKRKHPKEDEQKCIKCEKRIEDPEELKEHQEDCGTYLCGPCDKWFTRRSHLEDHKNRKHPKEDGKTTKIEQNIEEHDEKCYLCQKQYRCKRELEKHEDEHHRWRCDKCRNGYIDIEELDEHLRKEHGIESHKCSNKCGKSFETIERLIKHEEQECGKTTIIEQDIEDHEWKCYLCQKQYRCTKELEKHEDEHHRWRCDKCENGYIYINELDEHLKKEHGIESHQCSNECGKSFETIERLIKHEEQECGKTTEQNTEQLIEHEEYDDIIMIEQECGKTMMIEQDTEDHEKKCYLCKKQYRCTKELEEHEEEYHNWRCDKCENGYTNVKDLDEHMKTEHGIEEQQCTECGKKCKTIEELIEHEETECGNTIMTEQDTEELIEYEENDQCDQNKKQDRFECIECDEDFNDWNKWKEHVREEHEIYVCEDPECFGNCNTWFYFKKDIEHHIKKKHSQRQEARMYECKMCREEYLYRERQSEEKYTSVEMLSKHMKEKHGMEFYCEFCEKYYKYVGQYESHMFTHGIYDSVDKVIENEDDGECEKCGKYFGNRTNLEGGNVEIEPEDILKNMTEAIIEDIRDGRSREEIEDCMEKHVGEKIGTEHIQNFKKLIELLYSNYESKRSEEIEKEKSSETREVENRVENDETINIIAENSESIVETLQPEKTSTEDIITEETVGDTPDITTEENVVETPDVITEEIVEDTPGITTEETVGHIPDIDTKETVEETPGVKIKEIPGKRLKELEEVMIDWIEFNFTEHKSEEEYLLAREKMIKIEEEKQITQIEWDTIWRMFVRKKRKERKKQRQKSHRKRKNIRKTTNRISIYKNKKQWISMKDIWPDGLKKHSTLKTEKRRGQVIVKGQENPLTRRKQNREKLMLNEKYKSVVVFEPDLKLKRLDIEELEGQVIVKGQENPLTGGKQLLLNKKAEKVLNAINECWNSPFGRLKIEFKNFSKLQHQTNRQMPDAWYLMPDAA